MPFRRVFYNKLTGNSISTYSLYDPIHKIPTLEEDISSNIRLINVNRDVIGIIEFHKGEYEEDVLQSSLNFQVNPKTEEVGFSYPDPNEPEVEQPYQPPLNVEVAKLKQENTLLKAQTQANADRADFQEELIVELAMIVYS